MKRSPIKLAVAIILFVVSVQWLVQYTRDADRMLYDVEVSETDQYDVLFIKFNLPMRYTSHFPEGKTDFVQVRLQGLAHAALDKHEHLTRAALDPKHLRHIPLSDVVYEGNVPGGPFLSLRFSVPVVFEIQEDRHLKGIRLLLPKSST